MRNRFTLFSSSLSRGVALLLMILFPLLGWGQVTIASQDFETTPATPTVAMTATGGAFYTGLSASGDRPATSPFGVGTSRAFGLTSASTAVTTITTTSAVIDASAYTNISVSFRLAAFSIGSTGNGVDQPDAVKLAISTDGGTTYSEEVAVTGPSVLNATWAYTATGVAARSYVGNNTPSIFAPTTTGAQTTNGYSTVSVSGIASTSQLRFRITLNNNATSERWVLDDVLVKGTAAAPTVTTDAVTAITSTTATAGGNVTADGGASVTERGVVYGTATAPTTAGSKVTSGTGTGTFIASLTGLTASTLYYVRAYAINSVGTNYGSEVTFTTAATPSTPSLTATPATLTGFTYSTSGGGPSASQNYVLNGTNLNVGDLTVTGSTNYDVSADNINFVGPVTVTNTAGGTLPATTIYVRLKAGLPAGPYNSETIANTGGGAPAANVTVSGSVTTPTITVSVTSLPSFSAQVPTPSAPQNYTVGGTNLTNDIIVTPPSGYEIAIGAASTTYFATPQTLAQTAGTVATTTIRVRLIGATAGPYGTPAVPFTVANASTGATQQDVAVNGVVAPMQALTVTPAVLSGFNTTQGTPSAAQSYVLAGTDLTSTVAVSAPGGYQVSQTSATAGFAASQTVTQAAATAGTTIYVRLTGAAVGTFGTAGTPVNITNVATGATTKTVALDGATTAVPFLTVTPTPSPLNAFNTLLGTPSAAQSFTLSGTALTNDVVVTAPGEYEVSQTSATAGFAATQTVLQATATAGTTIFVRLTGATAGTFGTTATPLQVSITTTGAVSRTVDVKGTVVGEPAAAPAPTVVAGTTTAATVPLTLGAGAGTNLLVVVRPDVSSATAPVDGTTYTASTTYGTGTVLGSGRVVFAAANATSVTVTGLTPSTSYVADVYSYNVGTVAGFDNYQPVGGTSGTFTTTAPPATVAGQLILEENFDYAATTVLSTQGWTVASVGTPVVSTASGNLISTTYPQGAALSATPPTTSSKAGLTPTGEDLYKGGARPASTTVYGSAIINVSAAQNGGDYFTALAPSSSTYRNRVYIKNATGGYVFGLGASSEAATYSTTVFSFGTSYVMVMKAENSAATGNFDVNNLFVLPVDTDIRLEPVTPLLSVNTVLTGNAALNAFVLRQGSASSAPTLTIDGIRLATGWGAAVGRPVYTAAATLAAGNYYDLAVTGAAAVLSASGAAVLENNLNLNGGKIITSATNSLTLRNGVTTQVDLGGTSFVDGPLKRESILAPSLFFPIGRGTNYRPITLNITAAPAGTTTFTASQTEGRPTDQTLNAPLARISSVRYYSVTPIPAPGVGTFSGNIELSYGTNDVVTDPSLSSFVVAKSDGLGWSSIGRSGNTANSLTSGTFTSFSDFILATTDPDLTINPLPVQLTSFSAQRQADNAVAVKWNTASEKNSARFEVQRSLNGREYATVATATARGNSTQATTYAVLDKTAPAASLYYRLRQVDQDGSFSFSPVVTVVGIGQLAKVLLYPNPTTGSLHFLTQAALPYRVLNQLGQPVLRGTTEAGEATVPAETLKTGLYFLELQTAAGRVVQKFEKQ